VLPQASLIPAHPDRAIGVACQPLVALQDFDRMAAAFRRVGRGCAQEQGTPGKQPAGPAYSVPALEIGLVVMAAETPRRGIG